MEALSRFHLLAWCGNFLTTEDGAHLPGFLQKARATKDPHSLTLPGFSVPTIERSLSFFNSGSKKRIAAFASIRTAVAGDAVSLADDLAWTVDRPGSYEVLQQAIPPRCIMKKAI
jgi:hypothetical protein